MQERHWHLDTADGHRIYGATNSIDGASPDHCVVIVHGLTGNMNEYQHKTAAHFFAGMRYDAIRFNLYSDFPGGRRLSDCTLQTHAADLNAVLDSVAADYRRVYLIGHSYGGPTIMTAQPARAAAISLWDPSFDLKARWDVRNRPDIKRRGDALYLDWGVEVLIGDALIEEAMTDAYDASGCLALSAALNRPIQVINASEGRYAAQEQSWHSAGHPANERVVVDGADHCFHNGLTLNDALAHSLTWFRRFAS